MRNDERRQRVIISGVRPEVDAGRYAIKRVAGQEVIVTADLFGDGHDLVAGDLLWRRAGKRKWNHIRLEATGNDDYRASFPVEGIGGYEFTVSGWVDEFGSWRRDLAKRVDADQDVSVDLRIGAALVMPAAERAKGVDRRGLEKYAALLEGDATIRDRIDAALSDHLLATMDRWPNLEHAVEHAHVQPVWVDRARAGFSAWYEMFPRSTAGEPGGHGTFKDAAKRLPYIADLGFDVVYLPPIHPIGRTLRKGKNNNPKGEPGDVGSPWAIGAKEGGHEAIHPDLGTMADFKSLLDSARKLDMEIAIDLALQCAPDHPWVTDHPGWFRQRPDGTVQYAENPPKKYQDIYPLHFGGDKPDALWNAIHNVVKIWIDAGVKIFRVDNPHTKPFRFWEWLIARIRKDHPDVLFLAEAFTRPKVMYHLGKIGFTQSYTYFTWRNSAWEFAQYLTELTAEAPCEFFRPNFWPNTPDILPEHLQKGGMPAFAMRTVLATTLSGNWGMYGPAFELMEHVAVKEGSEEYVDSEKYEVRAWDLDREPNVTDLIRRMNRIRRENPALQQTNDITFHPTSNAELLCYSKRSEDGENTVLVVVNMNWAYPHSGFLTLDLGALGLEAGESFTVRDLMDGERYTWEGEKNYVELKPDEKPAHVFVIERGRRAGVIG